MASRIDFCLLSSPPAEMKAGQAIGRLDDLKPLTIHLEFIEIGSTVRQIRQNEKGSVFQAGRWGA